MSAERCVKVMCNLSKVILPGIPSDFTVKEDIRDE